MIVNHTPMSIHTKFQIDWIDRKRVVLSFLAKPVNSHITLYTSKQ